MGKRLGSICAVAMLCSMAQPLTAFAEGLSGHVTDEAGMALEGTAVTIIEDSVGRKTTLYTNAEGRFAFTNTPGEPFDVRARRMGMNDITHENVEAGIGGVDRIVDFQMLPSSQDELLETLPAHVWTERVSIDDPEGYLAFRVNCMVCHQQGNPQARWAETRDDWDVIFNRMAHKGARITKKGRDDIAYTLLDAFDTEGPLGFPRTPPSPKGAETRVEVTEWVMPHYGNTHDVAPGPDGRVYGADISTNNILRLDPATGIIDVLDDPKSKPKKPKGLHSVLPSFDGKTMWFTYTDSNEVAQLNIETEELTSYKIPFFKGFYPHTLRFDAEGTPWFTMSASNQIGKVDLKKGKIKLYNLPAKDLWQWAMSKTPFIYTVYAIRDALNINTIKDLEEVPSPYGIDVGPDGKIWFGLWTGSAIGYLDPKTEEIEVIDTPFGGPRRFRFDSKGDLWIPAFDEGLVYRFTPKTRQWKSFDLPTGRGDAHYALTVDPKDDSVWIAGSNSDTIMRLDPKTAETLVYQLPTRVTWPRELYFDEAGDLWTSYAMSPSSFMEAGTGSFVRLRVLP